VDERDIAKDREMLELTLEVFEDKAFAVDSGACRHHRQGEGGED